MTLLGHDRYCDEITAQTTLVRELVRDAELTTSVPTCPGWTLGTLVRHIGGNLRTVELAVRTGGVIDRSDEQVPLWAGPAGGGKAALDQWLAEAVATYVGTLRKAGPDGHAQVWGVPWSTLMWIRRAVHDIVIHRADASIAVGAGYTVGPQLASDAVDEMLELFAGLQAVGAVPALADLRGLQRCIHVTATDTDEHWHIELGADGFTWRRGSGAAAVTLQGALTDVLLVLYRRLPPTANHVQVRDDAALLDFWLERVPLV